MLFEIQLNYRRGILSQTTIYRKIFTLYRFPDPRIRETNCRLPESIQSHDFYRLLAQLHENRKFDSPDFKINLFLYVIQNFSYEEENSRSIKLISSFLRTILNIWQIFHL